MRVSRAAAALGAVLLLSACTPDAGTSPDRPDPQLFESNVDVDTPELRTLKRQIGLEQCPDPAGSDGGLPDVTLPCLGGGPSTSLAALDGPLVLNLWAQWCGPCREELPYYQRLHREAGDRLQVLGLDFMDTQPAAALELLGQSGVTYPSFADPGGETEADLRVRGLPVVVLVDESGEVVFNRSMVVRSYDDLRDLVEEHLDVRL